MKSVKVFTAPAEPEAKMYQEMLFNSGIKSEIKLGQSAGGLRGWYGGAKLPFEDWQILVLEKDVQRAKSILPEAVTRAFHPTNTARVFAYAGLGLIGLFILSRTLGAIAAMFKLNLTL